MKRTFGSTGGDRMPGSGSRAAKDALFEGFATVAKALANGRRLEILELLNQGPRTVEQVAEAIDQSTANTSHHLRTLARSGLLRRHRDGNHVIYELANHRVGDLWEALRDVAAERHADIERLADAYLGDTSHVETIDRDELARRLEDDGVVVLDVRPLVEYQAGHIPGAIHVPPDEVDDIIEALPDDHDIVAYCRGPYCVFAHQAVRILTDRGLSARRLRDGLPEWRREGRPIEAGLQHEPSSTG